MARGGHLPYPRRHRRRSYCRRFPKPLGTQTCGKGTYQLRTENAAAENNPFAKCRRRSFSLLPSPARSASSCPSRLAPRISQSIHSSHLTCLQRGADRNQYLLEVANKTVFRIENVEHCPIKQGRAEQNRKTNADRVRAASDAATIFVRWTNFGFLTALPSPAARHDYGLLDVALRRSIGRDSAVGKQNLQV